MGNNVRKIYKIERVLAMPNERGDVIATVETSEGDIYPLRHYAYHSPTGFEFGYAGSGPADLALSILLDHFDEWPTKEQMYRGQSLAWHGHELFKFAFISPGTEPGFTITSEGIDYWVNMVWLPGGGLDELRESLADES